MSLILAPEPFVRPATEEQTFPGIWIRTMGVNAHEPGQAGSLYFEFVPFDPNTGGIAPEAVQTLSVPLFECVAEVPEAAAAMEAVFAAFPEIRAWAESRNAAPPEE